MRRRSFVVFAILVLALLIGILEMVRPQHATTNPEDRAVLAQAAQSRENQIGWAIVCDDKSSAVNESARLESFIQQNYLQPIGSEAIVDGCSWGRFKVHVPVVDSDLPTLLTADPDHPNARWYRADMTFKSGPRVGETLNDAYVMLDVVMAQSLQ